MITIVDYEAGNLTSVKRALDYLQIPCEITADPDAIRNAERVIFPGVGNAASAMETLVARGLDKALEALARAGTPLLGICLGTQIILSYSEEGDTTCLGLIEGACRRFYPGDASLKIPHMGWDSVTVTARHPVLDGVAAGDEFYFVHSFYPIPADPEMVCALCDYGIEFPAVIGRGNIIATQFHPEKSGPAGLALLKRFSRWDGSPC